GELADGDRRIVIAGPHEIGVFFKDGAFYAYSNYCLHAGGPACEGLLINRVVDLIAADRTYQGQSFGDEVHFVCPWHGYEYELKTGECGGDRKLKVRKYEVGGGGEDFFVVQWGRFCNAGKKTMRAELSRGGAARTPPPLGGGGGGGGSCRGGTSVA